MKPLLLLFLLLGPYSIGQDDAKADTFPEAPAPTEEVGQNNPVPAYQPPRDDLPTINRTEIYTNMLGALLLVLGLIMATAYGIKKLFPNQLGSRLDGKSLRLVQSLPLGPRRTVALIEADGKRLLLGVTDTQINLIKALNEVDFEDTLHDMEPPKTVSQLMGEEVP